MARVRRQYLKFWIPIFGTRQLIKRIERLERELNELRASEDKEALLIYYEARIEAIYDSICQRINLETPVIKSDKINIKRQR